MKKIKNSFLIIKNEIFKKTCFNFPMYLIDLIHKNYVLQIIY
jgi:hypothetical protein